MRRAGMDQGRTHCLHYDLHLCHGSASVERVFSMVNDMFGDDQKSVLADQIQAGVMLRYNKRAIG